MGRAEIIGRLEAVRETNEFADLAFYAYRDLNRTEAEPFLRAALERCPVSIAATAWLDDGALVDKVEGLAGASIYDEPGRLAQPDEVWNYGRGDGVEKALLLANVLRSRHPGRAINVEVRPDGAELRAGELKVAFSSEKGLRAQSWDCGALEATGRARAAEPRPPAA